MSILTTDKRSVRPALPAFVEHSWQQELRQAIRDPAELCRRLSLESTWAVEAVDGSRQFPLFVPPAYLERICPGDPADPLLRQVLPLAAEGKAVEGFSADPVADSAAELQPGVLQKYAGRALLITTGACAVHCRYCFRRHYPYEQSPHSDSAWDHALGAIAADDSVEEVILSGGDPLMLVDQRLSRLVEKIASLPHVSRLRVHTRLPIMVPSRVTKELLDWLAGSRLHPVMVIHANHARELGDDVAAALAKLRQAGVLLLNQAVLLRGVNDSIASQCELSRRLVAVGVVPYYLHQLDRVAGAAHFEVPIDEGLRIVDKMRTLLPGYLMPQYVQELPGEPHKTVLA